MDYYSKKLFIAQVDKNNQILGKIDRWQAHEKGVLHRAFTVGIYYKNKLILQHRKHPVFNGLFDLTASSHPVFIKKKLEDETTAIYKTLKREWNIKKTDLLSEPQLKGKVVYKSKMLGYTEHEVCSLFISRIKHLPKLNFKYAYGFSLLSLPDLKSLKQPLRQILAPWVIEFLNEGLI